MTKMIKYPSADNATKDEWKVMIQDLEAFTSGLMVVGVDNINTDGVPSILPGSLLALNGSRYTVHFPSAETIAGQAVNNAQNYIYAVTTADGLSVTFMYSTVAPQWDAAKGGWYAQFNPGAGYLPDDYHRAIVKLFVTGGKYNNKVILDSYSAMFMVNTKQPVPTSGGVSISIPSYVANRPFDGEFNLEPGIYRYELKGGDGGKGGGRGYQGGNAEGWGDLGASGTDGGVGEIRTGSFVWHGGKIKVMVGADGGDGGKGADIPSTATGYAGNGGGGGGGLDSRIGEITARGGMPGIGGKRANNYFENVMPGSPGGYGIGGNGSETLLMDYYGWSSGSFRPGGRGEGPNLNLSGGYARLWRVG